MKVLAINGSARKDGNTAILIEKVFEPLEAAGIETELVQLAGNVIPGCRACYQCFEKQDGRCSQTKDPVNDLIEGMCAADGIILGSPVYFTSVTTEMKALMDRAGLVSKANGELFRRKVGAAVVAVRRAGSIHTFDTLNHFFQIGQMITPGSSYWNVGIGRDPGEVRDDEEGLRTMQVLGENMAWLLKKLAAEEGDTDE